jgi:hypothetical protein
MSGIELDAAITSLVNNAFDERKPILIAYVDGEGQPKLSFRGSTHVHGPDQLAIWVRDPEGGLLASIGDRPRITLFYRDPPVQYFFFGRGHLEEDEQTRNRVFNESPEAERGRDLEMKGKALVIDLDRVTGGGPDGRIDLTR